LTLGDPGGRGSELWDDPAKHGLTIEHIEDLIRMIGDGRLHRDREPVCWAPVHAWRAAAQLDPAGLIEPMIKILDRLARWGDDFGLEEVPEVFALIGPACLPSLAKLIQDQRRPLWARVAGVSALMDIGADHPATRDDIINLVVNQLDRSPYNDPILNAFLVSLAVDLRLHEARYAVALAYRCGDVDESVVGTLPSVLEEMSMSKEEWRAVMRERYDEIERRLEVLPGLTLRTNSARPDGLEAHIPGAYDSAPNGVHE
jgi:hypothetical protein